MTRKQREEIRKVFARNRGAAAQLARDLERAPSTISLWLHCHANSKKIAQAAAAMAEELKRNEEAV